MTRETQSQRLDRIEDKIDKLSDAMVSLARAEEKLIAIEKNNHSSLERMNRLIWALALPVTTKFSQVGEGF